MANNVSDAIMKLLGMAAERGQPMEQSAGLQQFLRDAQSSGRRPVTGPNVVDARAQFPGAQPPSIGKDSWFNQGGATDNPKGMIDAYDLLNRNPNPLGDSGPVFIWGLKNGKRMKLDGPFATPEEAQPSLQRLQKRVDPRTGFTLELGPDGKEV